MLHTISCHDQFCAEGTPNMYVIFYMDVPAYKIVKGMTIYIHLIPGLKNEILRVTAK